MSHVVSLDKVVPFSGIYYILAFSHGYGKEDMEIQPFLLRLVMVIGKDNLLYLIGKC